MNTIVYTQSNIVALQNNTLIANMAQFNDALIFPQTQEFEIPKNFDSDPITPEEEIDLMKSDMDIANGRVAKFSANDSKEEMLKHLGLL